ncbi:hypothetical protein IBG34_11515 [Aeromonas media]|nr:hypothetical protein [Aeromonas media]QYK83422.1 hypothetical protein IBG34_11515 [Aeromonas media]
MQPEKELITETALLEMANGIIKDHEDREFNFEVRHSPMPPDGTLRIP